MTRDKGRRIKLFGGTAGTSPIEKLIKPAKLTAREKIACYLLDRADQYDTNSASWVGLADAAEAVMNGEHEQAASEGFDIELVRRVRLLGKLAKL